MSATIVSSLISFVSTSLAVPLLPQDHLDVRTVSATSSSAPAWALEPSGRRTYSLLLSYFLTLSLCVWTSIHLNICSRNSTILSTALHVFAAAAVVFGPEFVVLAAYDQRANAEKVRNRINEIHQRGIIGDLAINVDRRSQPLCI